MNADARIAPSGASFSRFENVAEDRPGIYCSSRGRRVTRMAFETPHETYERVRAGRDRYDSNDLSLARLNPWVDEAREEVGRVNPLKSWPDRRVGWTDADIDVCMGLLHAKFEDDEDRNALAVELLSAEVVGLYKRRANRAEQAEANRDANHERQLIQDGMPPAAASGAIRADVRPEDQASQRQFERATGERTRVGDPGADDRSCSRSGS